MQSHDADEQFWNPLCHGEAQIIPWANTRATDATHTHAASMDIFNLRSMKRLCQTVISSARAAGFRGVLVLWLTTVDVAKKKKNKSEAFEVLRVA